ncbi:EEF1A lysine methyltransferase 1-like isoform X4 [Vigna radiata var. radiata]|uniref:EEF1A lysine methyltransferase 1-like isoform X4 n=1 Tax=Vigna radiata var. radiata TaxID=3916 RepID=A0A3Q0FFW1_VIGRR|nr:EEF1A lysine methyltransferase 1-like isoform X4 [Vigna radiata var. radiata]
MADQLQLNPNSVTGITESSAPSDDEEPSLSSHTLAALKEFLAEQQHHSDAGGGSEVSLVSENWNLSQFWYTPETAKTVAKEVLTLCSGVHTRVACIACPTLYVYLKFLAMKHQSA